MRDGLADHGAQGCNLRRAAKAESTKERVFGPRGEMLEPYLSGNVVGLVGGAEASGAILSW